MSAFKQQLAALPPVGAAQSTIVLQPDAFAATWDERPRVPVTFGLRIPSESDVQSARAAAVERAHSLHDEMDKPLNGQALLDAFEDAVLAQLVSYALCDPENVNDAHPLLQLPQDQVEDALTPTAIRYIYDAVDRLQVATGPLYPEADGTDLSGLMERLAAGQLDRLPRVSALRCRRFLRMVLDELKALDG